MIHRGWKRLASQHEWIAAWRRQPWWGAISWAITLIAVLIGWVFFRAQTLNDALLMVRRMFHPVLTLEPWVNTVGVMVGLALLGWQYTQRLPALRAGLRALPVTITGATIAVGIAVALILAPEGATPFIYFQF
jgi:alginate O-acetyltransferase complex protein AlgI